MRRMPQTVDALFAAMLPKFGELVAEQLAAEAEVTYQEKHGFHTVSFLDAKRDGSPGPNRADLAMLVSSDAAQGWVTILDQAHCWRDNQGEVNRLRVKLPVAPPVGKGPQYVVPGLQVHLGAETTTWTHVDQAQVWAEAVAKVIVSFWKPKGSGWGRRRTTPLLGRVASEMRGSTLWATPVGPDVLATRLTYAISRHVSEDERRMVVGRPDADAWLAAKRAVEGPITASVAQFVTDALGKTTGEVRTAKEVGSIHTELEVVGIDLANKAHREEAKRAITRVVGPLQLGGAGVPELSVWLQIAALTEASRLHEPWSGINIGSTKLSLMDPGVYESTAQVFPWATPARKAKIAVRRDSGLRFAPGEFVATMLRATDVLGVDWSGAACLRVAYTEGLAGKQLAYLRRSVADLLKVISTRTETSRVEKVLLKAKGQEGGPDLLVEASADDLLADPTKLDQLVGRELVVNRKNRAFLFGIATQSQRDGDADKKRARGGTADWRKVDGTPVVTAVEVKREESAGVTCCRVTLTLEVTRTLGDDTSPKVTDLGCGKMTLVILPDEMMPEGVDLVVETGKHLRLVSTPGMALGLMLQAAHEWRKVKGTPLPVEKLTRPAWACKPTLAEACEALGKSYGVTIENPVQLIQAPVVKGRELHKVEQWAWVTRTLIWPDGHTQAFDEKAGPGTWRGRPVTLRWANSPLLQKFLTGFLARQENRVAELLAFIRQEYQISWEKDTQRWCVKSDDGTVRYPSLVQRSLRWMVEGGSNIRPSDQTRGVETTINPDTGKTMVVYTPQADLVDPEKHLRDANGEVEALAEASWTGTIRDDNPDGVLIQLPWAVAVGVAVEKNDGGDPEVVAPRSCFVYLPAEVIAKHGDLTKIGWDAGGSAVYWASTAFKAMSDLADISLWPHQDHRGGSISTPQQWYRTPCNDAQRVARREAAQAKVTTLFAYGWKEEGKVVECRRGHLFEWAQRKLEHLFKVGPPAIRKHARIIPGVPANEIWVHPQYLARCADSLTKKGYAKATRHNPYLVVEGMWVMPDRAPGEPGMTYVATIRACPPWLAEVLPADSFEPVVGPGCVALLRSDCDGDNLSFVRLLDLLTTLKGERVRQSERDQVVADLTPGQLLTQEWVEASSVVKPKFVTEEDYRNAWRSMSIGADSVLDEPEMFDHRAEKGALLAGIEAILSKAQVGPLCSMFLRGVWAFVPQWTVAQSRAYMALFRLLQEGALDKYVAANTRKGGPSAFMAIRLLTDRKHLLPAPKEADWVPWLASMSELPGAMAEAEAKVAFRVLAQLRLTKAFVGLAQDLILNEFGAAKISFADGESNLEDVSGSSSLLLGYVRDWENLPVTDAGRGMGYAAALAAKVTSQFRFGVYTPGVNLSGLEAELRAIGITPDPEGPPPTPDNDSDPEPPTPDPVVAPTAKVEIPKGEDLHLLLASAGSGGNVGFAVAICVGNQPTSQFRALTIHRKGVFGTQNMGTYFAACEGLSRLGEYAPSSVTVHTTSKLVVGQLNGETGVKDQKLKALVARVTSLVTELAVPVSFEVIDEIPKELKDTARGELEWRRTLAPPAEPVQTVEEVEA